MRFLQRKAGLERVRESWCAVVAVALACILIPADSRAEGAPRDYWFGETYFDETGLMSKPYRFICRWSPDGYRLCLSITPSTEISQTGQTREYGFVIELALEKPPLEGDPLMDTSRPPVIQIDGRPVEGVRDQEYSDEHGVYWIVVNFVAAFEGSDRGRWNGTRLTFNQLTTGNELMATVFREDGTEHAFQFPLTGLKDLIYVLLPTCCRNPQ